MRYTSKNLTRHMKFTRKLAARRRERVIFSSCPQFECPVAATIGHDEPGRRNPVQTMVVMLDSSGRIVARKLR
jgi:hypothetical protein